MEESRSPDVLLEVSVIEQVGECSPEMDVVQRRRGCVEEYVVRVRRGGREGYGDAWRRGSPLIERSGEELSAECAWGRLEELLDRGFLCLGEGRFLVNLSRLPSLVVSSILCELVVDVLLPFGQLVWP